MLEILIPQKWTHRQVKDAKVKAAEFRRNKFTTGSANLDDMVALKKAVILCGSHARKFEYRKAKYAPHPDKNMRIVKGTCDVCKAWDLCTLFLNGKDAEDQHRALEKYRRDREYATLIGA